ncbi:PaaI family thioesterase [Azohydromonas australica]|uniref:PaaI family thioesterase n=1 Tax=Azohydromonas australica TaxID=364039 RepID=UPI000A058E09|nr:PaaI family thioesterase [Azohydromonas australica]
MDQDLAGVLPADSPFSLDLGIKVLEWAEGRALIALDVDERHTNRRGVAHGGVIATLADMALSLAWRSAAPERPPAGTVNLSVTFVAPAHGRITAEGRLLHMTGSCAFCEGRILNGDGGLAAVAQGTFRMRWATKDSGEGAHPHS